MSQESKKLLQLENENKILQNKLKEYQKKEKQKDEILIHQTKLATMGEMLHNISHQFRQPLMEISSHFINIEAKIKLQGTVTNDEILDMIEKSNVVLTYLSQTIEDFRDFFTKNKAQESFFVTESLTTCVNILKNSFLKENIKLNLYIKSNLKIFGVKNEFTQVLINIITNAKDAIVSNNINNGKINILIYEKDDNCIVQISDNAGGIKCQSIEDIFSNYFSYKKENGSGIGLFMSKLIVEKNMKGIIQVKNNQEGAVFEIICPKG